MAFAPKTPKPKPRSFVCFGCGLKLDTEGTDFDSAYLDLRRARWVRVMYSEAWHYRCPYCKD